MRAPPLAGFAKGGNVGNFPTLAKAARVRHPQMCRGLQSLGRATRHLRCVDGAKSWAGPPAHPPTLLIRCRASRRIPNLLVNDRPDCVACRKEKAIFEMVELVAALTGLGEFVDVSPGTEGVSRSVQDCSKVLGLAAIVAPLWLLHWSLRYGYGSTLTMPVLPPVRVV